MPEIFTIGHSCHELARLIELLEGRGVQAVADVRSSPYSARLPQFNREALQAALRLHGINYVFLGKELGARRAERDSYAGSRADYGLIAQLPAFRQGLERVRAGSDKFRVALLCAEKDPLECHRTILVCRELKKLGFTIHHILETGAIETHEEAERRLMAEESVPSEDLFLTAADLLSQAYERRAERIAYKEEAGNPAAS